MVMAVTASQLTRRRFPAPVPCHAVQTDPFMGLFLAACPRDKLHPRLLRIRFRSVLLLSDRTSRSTRASPSDQGWGLPTPMPRP